MCASLQIMCLTVILTEILIGRGGVNCVFNFSCSSKILFSRQIVYLRLSKCTTEDDGAPMACATVVNKDLLVYLQFQSRTWT
ncbi:hypothetical protein SEVIR_2G199532v4 [Setaria viridis]|uniref:Secreted protein n=1 Tax=Setaria viridis TaxID=4556 RepID=A0A4U6VST3_SETVI|nr:hypothetical protein SEVIR_2G199532v2 [Setaria viridis]